MSEEETKAYLIKSKAIPVQSWPGPESSRMLRVPDFRRVVSMSALCIGRLYRLANIPGSRFS